MERWCDGWPLEGESCLLSEAKNRSDWKTIIENKLSSLKFKSKDDDDDDDDHDGGGGVGECLYNKIRILCLLI